MSKFLSWLKKSYIFIILFLIYVPLIVLVIWSFSKPSFKGNITNNFEWNGGENYVQLFQNNDFINGLLNTLIIALISTPISVILATITCYGIWNSNKYIVGATNFNSNVSVISPEIITGISLTLLFSSTWIALGCNFGLFTIILSHISFCTPYAIIAIYPRITKLNKNLINASIDLGCNAFKTFFKIVIPFLLPSIIGALTIVFAMSFDDFIITNLVRGRITTISSEIYTMAKGIKMWAVTFGSLLVIIFVVILTIKLIVNFYQDKSKNKNKKINLSIYENKVGNKVEK